MIFACLGLLATTLMVFLGRIIYVFFFNDQCMTVQCLMDLNTSITILYGVTIFIGGFNAYMYQKYDKKILMIMDAIGSLFFAFAINLIYVWWDGL